MASLREDELDVARQRMTPQWLAGFFDGEGCATITVAGQRNDGRPHFRMMVGLTQTDFHLLRLVAEIFFDTDRKIYNLYHKKGQMQRQRVWQLTATGKNALGFLKIIQPHVVLKRKVVDLCIEMGESVGVRGRETSDEVFARRVELRSLVRQENGTERSVIQ